MPQATSPEGTATTVDTDNALNFNEGVDSLANLFSGSDDEVLNPGGTDQEDPEGEGVESVEASDEDQLQLEDEDVADDEAGLAPDDDRTAKPGQFVPDTGKVTLADGTILTVAELKRNNLFQSDYTRKTTELAETRKQVEADKEFVGKHAQAVAREREVFAAYMEKYLPKPPSPDLARTDPYGYQAQKAEYDDKMGVLSQIAAANQSAQRQQQEAYEASLAELKRSEAAKLFEAKPAFRDQRKFAEWYSEAGSLMIEKYHFTPEEVNEATDHRFYMMMDDLKRFHAALDRAKTAKPGQQRQHLQQGQRPKLLAGSNRNAPPQNTQQKTRQVYGERLKKTGTLEDAVGKLSTFDL